MSDKPFCINAKELDTLAEAKRILEIVREKLNIETIKSIVERLTEFECQTRHSINIISILKAFYEESLSRAVESGLDQEIISKISSNLLAAKTDIEKLEKQIQENQEMITALRFVWTQWEELIKQE